jgi:hypothetical protein
MRLCFQHKNHILINNPTKFFDKKQLNKAYNIYYKIVKILLTIKNSKDKLKRDMLYISNNLRAIFSYIKSIKKKTISQ